MMDVLSDAFTFRQKGGLPHNKAGKRFHPPVLGGIIVSVLAHGGKVINRKTAFKCRIL